MYCPQCKSEYNSIQTICPVCFVSLVAEKSMEAKRKSSEKSLSGSMQSDSDGSFDFGLVLSSENNERLWPESKTNPTPTPTPTPTLSMPTFPELTDSVLLAVPPLAPKAASTAPKPKNASRPKPASKPSSIPGLSERYGFQGSTKDTSKPRKPTLVREMKAGTQGLAESEGLASAAPGGRGNSKPGGSCSGLSAKSSSHQKPAASKKPVKRASSFPGLASTSADSIYTINSSSTASKANLQQAASELSDFLSDNKNGRTTSLREDQLSSTASSSNRSTNRPQSESRSSSLDRGSYAPEFEQNNSAVFDPWKSVETPVRRSLQTGKHTAQDNKSSLELPDSSSNNMLNGVHLELADEKSSKAIATACSGCFLIFLFFLLFLFAV